MFNKKIDWVFVREGLVNVIMFFLFAIFAYNFGKKFLLTFTISSLIFLLNEGILVLIFLTRRMPKNVSISIYDWTIAIMGTYCALLIRPTDDVDDNIFGLMLMYIGILIMIPGTISLGRSFGIVPANRGIKTTLMYKYIRHPLYSSYIFLNVGILINNFSIWNVKIVVLVIILLVLRMFQEEKFLSKNQEYKEYMQSTKWRLFPYLF